MNSKTAMVVTLIQSMPLKQGKYRKLKYSFCSLYLFKQADDTVPTNSTMNTLLLDIMSHKNFIKSCQAFGFPCNYDIFRNFPMLNSHSCILHRRYYADNTMIISISIILKGNFYPSKIPSKD